MRLHGGSAAEWRAHLVRWWFLPRAAHVLADPAWNSVTLAVAQYWDDEASDAVHLRCVPSSEAAPSWPLPELAGGSWRPPWWTAARTAEAAVHGGCQALDPYLDNLDLVVAFAAFCEPSCHQEMEITEAYRPYALATRGDDGVDVEIVGVVRQVEWVDQPLRASRCAPSLLLERLQTRIDRVRGGATLTVDELLRALDGEALLAAGVVEAWKFLAAHDLGRGPSIGPLEDWLERHGMYT